MAKKKWTIKEIERMQLEALDREPTDGDEWLEKGCCCLIYNKFEDAKKCFEEASNFEDTKDKARIYLEQTRLIVEARPEV